MKRGDVVIIDFPYSDRTGSNVRPSLVVQSDMLNSIRDDAILAIITSMSSGRPDTEFLIEIADESGSGLRFDSYIQCDTLVTLDQSLVVAVIGSLSARDNAEGEPVPQGGAGAAMISLAGTRRWCERQVPAGVTPRRVGRHKRVRLESSWKA